MDYSQEISMNNAIDSVTGANNYNETNVIKKKRSKSVCFQERSVFAPKPVQGSVRSSFEAESVTNEERMLDMGDDTLKGTDESGKKVVQSTSTVHKVKKRKPDQYSPHHLDQNHPLARRPKPPKPTHEIAPLVQLTNIKIRKALKHDLRSGANPLRECQCKTSSLKFYKATQHQVSHILGKQAATSALQFDDYFNNRNFETETLPSFEDLLMKLNHSETESSSEAFPRPRSAPVRRCKTKPDPMMVLLNDLYRSAVKGLKSVEKKAEKTFGCLSAEERFERRLLRKEMTHFGKSFTAESAVSAPEQSSEKIKRKGSDADSSFLSVFSTITNEDYFPGMTETTSSEEREIREEYLMAQLEEKYRNSQKAPLSVYALEVGKSERKELEHLLDRFWAIYESRTVNFNHAGFSSYSDARWRLFSKKVMDQLVERLKATERNRAKYTEFLFPELKKKRRVSFVRKASSFPGQFLDESRMGGLPKPCKCNPDIVEKVHEAVDERKKIQDEYYEIPTVQYSSEEKTLKALYEYPEEEFKKIKVEATENPKFMKRIGEEFALPKKRSEGEDS